MPLKWIFIPVGLICSLSLMGLLIFIFFLAPDYFMIEDLSDPLFTILLFLVYPILVGILFRPIFNNFNKKWIKISATIFFLIALILLLISAPLTCSFGKDLICYAEKGTDITKCFPDTYNIDGWGCAHIIAKKTEDSSACLNLKNKLKIKGCLLAFAFEKKDPSICGELIDCYEDYARSNYKTYNCEDLEDIEDVNDCVHGLLDALEETEDFTICEGIPKEINLSKRHTAEVYTREIERHWTQEECYNDYINIINTGSLNDLKCLELPKPYNQVCLEEVEETHYKKITEDVINKAEEERTNNLNILLCDEFPEPHNKTCIQSIQNYLIDFKIIKNYDNLSTSLCEEFLYPYNQSCIDEIERRYS